ncbi:MAG: ATP-binding cassette domain-containing protein [Bacteroidia bacterium]|nr:ATP-binding cassette domain-containing protein [Bacteroidia bacterium]
MAPLSLHAHGLGHRFGARWLFRNLSFGLEPGARLAVTGPNGSGKSTLLRILAGQLAPEVGTLTANLGGKPLPPERWYVHLAWAGPAVELYAPLTVLDTLRLFYRAKPLALSGLDAWLTRTELYAHRSAPVCQLSSGQRGRLAVALAVFADTPLLLLDEPTANLDGQWTERVLGWLADLAPTRTLVLASNLPHEYASLPQRLALAPD